MRWGVALLVLVASGCAGRRIEASREELEQHRRIAVVARIAALPESDTPGVASEKLAGSMTRFVVGRRFEGGTMAQLPRFFQVTNPTQVAERLELLLVDQSPPTPLDYERLASLGVDSVLEIRVDGYGVRSATGGATGGFAHGRVRLATLKDQTVWQLPFDVDELRDGHGGDMVATDFERDPDTQWRLTVDRLSMWVGQLISAGLGPASGPEHTADGPRPPVSPDAARPPDAAE